LGQKNENNAATDGIIFVLLPRKENEEAMKKMDRFYMEHPTAGARTIARFGTPEIINSDQGSQYTSGLWAEACGNTMKVSMDGRGRAKDNIWIERFWRTIKREYIYLNPCDNAFELRKGIDNEIPERKYENNKLLIRTHKAA
jgi:transposase InsO family protein